MAVRDCEWQILCNALFPATLFGMARCANNGFVVAIMVIEMPLT